MYVRGTQWTAFLQTAAKGAADSATPLEGLCVTGLGPAGLRLVQGASEQAHWR
jgi:hypothetical protein